MTSKKFMEKLIEIDACGHAKKFCKGKTLHQAWILCDRPEWMMWLYEKANPDKKICVEIAVYSARLCLDKFERKYPDDKRPRKAIEAAENWLINPCDITISAAWSAAWSAGNNKKICEFIRSKIMWKDIEGGLK